MIGQLLAYFKVQALVFRRTLGTGKLIGLLMLLLVAMGATAIGLGAGIGVYFATVSLLDVNDDTTNILLWLDGLVAIYCMLWIFSLMTDLQRSDPFDLRKLLFLPIPLPTIFIANFLVSALSPMNLLLIPVLVGLLLGLIALYGNEMAFGAAHGVAFILTAAAISYFFRGLLANLFQNRRRRNLFLSLFTIGIILLFQLPNLFSSYLGEQYEEKMEALSEAARTVEGLERYFESEALAENDGNGLVGLLVAAHVYVPPLWLPYGIWSLVEGDGRGALLSFLGLFLIALLMLALAYRSTLKNLRSGGERGLSQSSSKAMKRPFTARAIPGLGDDCAALTEAGMLNLVRTQAGQMMLLSPLLFLPMYWALSSTPAFGGGTTVLPLFIVVMPFLNATHILFNQFGMDQEAFRTLLLMPTPRSRILMAKNLAIAPFVLLVSLVLITFFIWWMELSLMVWGRYTLLSFLAFFVLATVGNYFSIALPSRISARRPGMGGGRLLTFFSSLIGMIFLSICVALSFFVSDWLGGQIPVLFGRVELGTLLVQGGFSLGAFLFWFFSLTWAGDFLQEQEQSLLARLLSERE